MKSDPENPRGRRCPASPTGTDWALAFAAAAVLALTRVVRPEAVPRLAVCPFRQVTGLPCPGCGLTRGLFHLGHAEFRLAWELNPFSYAVFAFLAGLLLWPLWRRWRPQQAARWLASPWFDRAPLVLVAAMTLFGLGRLLYRLRGP